MDDKLLYIPKDYKQNCPYCSFKLSDKKFGHNYSFELTNQNLIKYLNLTN